MRPQASITTGLSRADGTDAAPRRLRSLVLNWRDAESGDEWTIDVRGSGPCLEALAPLGFVPADETSARVHKAPRSARAARPIRADLAVTSVNNADASAYPDARMHWVFRWRPGAPATHRVRASGNQNVAELGRRPIR